MVIRTEVVLALQETGSTHRDLSESLCLTVRGAVPQSMNEDFSVLMERYYTSENAKRPPGDDKVTNESSKGKHFQTVAKVTRAHFLFSFMMPLFMTHIMKYEFYCVILASNLIQRT